MSYTYYIYYVYMQLNTYISKKYQEYTMYLLYIYLLLRKFKRKYDVSYMYLQRVRDDLIVIYIWYLITVQIKIFVHLAHFCWIAFSPGLCVQLDAQISDKYRKLNILFCLNLCLSESIRLYKEIILGAWRPYGRNKNLVPNSTSKSIDFVL